MKKILLLIAVFVISLNGVCSAEFVRLFDGKRNDFVAYYNQTAIRWHKQGGMDIRIIENSFKKDGFISPLTGKHVFHAYTGYIGNDKNRPTTITIGLDESGFVEHLQLTGFVSPSRTEIIEPERRWLSAILLCMISVGMDSDEATTWMKSGGREKLRNTDDCKFSIKSGKKYIYVSSVASWAPPQPPRFSVEIFATDDGRDPDDF